MFFFPIMSDLEVLVKRNLVKLLCRGHSILENVSSFIFPQTSQKLG